MGQHLARHLRAEGDDVTVLDHRGASSLDITDGPAVTARLAAIEPEVVYHLAGWADVGASWNDPVGVFRVNAEGTLHVLRACRAAGVARVLAVASADVYGVVTEAELPLTEGSPLRPTSPYAASKLAADALAQQAFLGLRARRGPGAALQPPGTGPVRAVRGARHRRPHRPGRARRHRHDPGRQPVGPPRRHRRPGRGAGVSPARSSMAPRARSTTCAPGRTWPCRRSPTCWSAWPAARSSWSPTPALLRPVDLPVLRGDASKLRAATGWEPRIPIEQTVADLLDDMRERVRTETSTPSETP